MFLSIIPMTYELILHWLRDSDRILEILASGSQQLLCIFVLYFIPIKQTYYKLLCDLLLCIILRWLTIDYYMFKVESTINILQQLDIIGRTSELAKLFGIQFYEVLSRGSQVSYCS